LRNSMELKKAIEGEMPLDIDRVLARKRSMIESESSQELANEEQEKEKTMTENKGEKSFACEMDLKSSQFNDN